jgi:hypothetical protein
MMCSSSWIMGFSQTLEQLGIKGYVMIWDMIVELQLMGHRVLLLYLKIYAQCNHLTWTHIHKYVIKDLIHHVKNLALHLTPPVFLQQLLPPPLTWAPRESDGLRVPVFQPPVWDLHWSEAGADSFVKSLLTDDSILKQGSWAQSWCVQVWCGSTKVTLAPDVQWEWSYHEDFDDFIKCATNRLEAGNTLCTLQAFYEHMYHCGLLLNSKNLDMVTKFSPPSGFVKKPTIYL